MKKFLSLSFILLTSLMGVFSLKADNNWRIHPTFDEFVGQVIDTPDYVYFTSRNFPDFNGIDQNYFLFRYDRDGDELISLSTDNLLAANLIQAIQYNPEKGFITIVYSNYDIDLIYDDGKVVNIPYYRLSNPGFSRKVRSISSDPQNNRVYLATDFGYVVLNNSKAEIAESRIYGESLSSVCRLGDHIYALHGNNLIAAPLSSPRLTLSEYQTIKEFNSPLSLYPLNETQAVLISGNAPGSKTQLISINGSEVETKDIDSSKIVNVENNAQGVAVTTRNKIYQFSKDGKVTSLTKPENFSMSAAGLKNLNEIWFGESHKGLASAKVSDGKEWTVTRDFMLPDAPAPFMSPHFAQQSDLGLLAVSYGYLHHLTSFPDNDPLAVSSYKNGRWTNLSPLHANPDRGEVLINPNGIAVDPNDPSYAYISSPKNGFIRLNLYDPTDLIHFSHPGDASSKKDDFVQLVPPEDVLYGFCNFSPPTFDKQGNLWMAYQDWNHQNPSKLRFYCWTPEKRKATTSASNVQLPEFIELNANLEIANTSFIYPLLYSGNGLIVYVKSSVRDQIAIIDTGGTPLDSSDDQVYRFNNYTDKDGVSLNVEYASFAWEDPSTGYVWLGYATGVFYIDPKQVVNGDYHVNRVKVSRNDGTNLADYLLDGVAVYGMTSDNTGRKWFATGAGVICTSSDGREIISEFNTENSPLPSDAVFGIAYNSNSNSIVVSTSSGFAEYFLPAAHAGSNTPDIKVYPNPIRHDYTGYVTLTDIPEGSLVKIMDSAGNLVKELGRMEGFEMKWDISDVNFRRVGSGVYYIFISPGNESSSFSKVGKILVIS